MGLGGGRKRVKISNDPNNTNWSSSTSRFGHRMLTSQGWEPGSTLGSTNASYKSHLTQASKSHIRVVMRDDNLGLGAKRGSGQEAGECVALDAFQALLGRLNGKSEDVLKKEEEARGDLRRRQWVEGRGKGMMRFVFGGMLVQETEGEEEVKQEIKEEVKVKKEDNGQDDDMMERKARKEKNRQERKLAKADGVAPASDEDRDSSKTEKKKSKKRKKRSEGEEEVEQESNTAEAADEDAEAQSEDEATRKARRKAEKAEKRERKRLKREAKDAKNDAAKIDADTVEIKVEPVTAEEVIKETVVVKPAPSSATPTSNTIGRHMSVRSRYIAAKRRAVMDPQALKEIFAVKI